MSSVQTQSEAKVQHKDPSAPIKDSKSAQKQNKVHERRPNLLSPALSESRSTTIGVRNEGSSELICYLNTSQGFEWNPELFLPTNCDYTPLGAKSDPVKDIIVTDEDSKTMFPRD
ncbi:hypothetical protein F5883DRAFT_572688 [Diaporthe sp. PMI_573]|nr:hypothetical protein F5883DRAFT_572688 [Diaporthaceae sp. PMI_573]